MAVDWDEILSEAQVEVRRGNFNATGSDAVDLADDIKNVAYETGWQFVGELRKQVDASGLLGTTAKDELHHWDVGNIDRTDDFEATVDVIFTGDPARPSMVPELYPEGAYDIVNLLNDGYLAKHSVHGSWHGKDIYSRAVFPGAHFIEDAIRSFKDKYRKNGNVTVWSIERTD